MLCRARRRKPQSPQHTIKLQPVRIRHRATRRRLPGTTPSRRSTFRASKSRSRHRRGRRAPAPTRMASRGRTRTTWPITAISSAPKARMAMLSMPMSGQTRRAEKPSSSIRSTRKPALLTSTRLFLVPRPASRRATSTTPVFRMVPARSVLAPSAKCRLGNSRTGCAMAIRRSRSPIIPTPRRKSQALNPMCASPDPPCRHRHRCSTASASLAGSQCGMPPEI